MPENELIVKATEIFATVWRDVTVEKLHYKHFANPDRVRCPVLLHYEDDVPVGMNGFMGQTFIVNNERIKGVQSCDSAVIPKYRGKGIFSMIIRQGEQKVQEEVSFLFGSPNPNSYPGFIKLGWKHIGNLNTYMLPIELQACFETFVGMKLPKFISRIWNVHIKKKLMKIARVCPDVYVQESDECLLSRDDFSVLNSLFFISAERSLSYYKWKIDNNRNRKFKYCYAMKDGLIQAFIVYIETQRQGYKVIDIIDWQCVRDQDNAYALFAILFLSKALDCIIIKINAVNSMAQESISLKKIGFIDVSSMPFVKAGEVPGTIPIVFKPFNDVVREKMGDFKRWQLRYLDFNSILN